MAFKTLAEMRKGRGSTVADLSKEVEKLSKGGFEKDTRLWKITTDKSGAGSAVIRFLPAPQGEDLAWARMWSHGFKGPTGKWYIENSLTTLDKTDPCGELNSELWARGDEAGKQQARDQKRKMNYYSNILVISDPKSPENEGKVFLFRYGKKIFDKIKDSMQPPPEDDDKTPVNPFDFWEGANFKFKARLVEGYPNYDKSSFEEPSPLSEDEAQVEAIWDSEYSLTELLDPKHFKSYDQLKRQLNMVLGIGTVAAATVKEDDDDETPEPAVRKPFTKPTAAKKPVVEEEVEEEEKPAPAAKKAGKAVVSKEKRASTPPAVEEEDDSINYFARLAADDN